MIATQRKTASSGFQMNRTAHLHALRCVPRLVHDCSVSSILICLVRVTGRVEAGNSATVPFAPSIIVAGKTPSASLGKGRGVSVSVPTNVQ